MKVTTSRDPSAKARRLAKALARFLSLPYITRGKQNLDSIETWLVVIESYKNPSGLIKRYKGEERKLAFSVLMEPESSQIRKLKNIMPNLAFDLFTVQRSSLLANGTADPNFKNFGLAWYQSDVQVTSGGTATVKIQTILLDQIFGFDPDVSLAPTNTFHVGFWFNDPADAAACGFTGTTPFNGDHNAGPLAMISLPDPVTNLGPLCTNPNTSTDPPSCNP